jgi:hypothetical protein
MAHCNTILSQILKYVPRHEFEELANRYHSGRVFRTASRWSQFVTMSIGQLSGRRSLRDVVENVEAQQQRLYHLGSTKLSRSNLSRINENKPYQLYEALFGKLLKRCQSLAPGHGFRFKNELYSMDATTIDLCLSLFPWATFRTAKSGIKLHVAMNHKGNLPEFTDQTIEFTGTVTHKRCPIPLRRIGFRDPDTGKRYVFLTNNFALAASTIAAIYKACWQIELFFKWIKQNLKIKSFMGTSKNAVMTQIWIALCAYLLIAFLKFQSKSKRSMQQILRLLQTNLFEKWSLDDLVHGRPAEKVPINDKQLSFTMKLTGH